MLTVPEGESCPREVSCGHLGIASTRAWASGGRVQQRYLMVEESQTTSGRTYTFSADDGSRFHVSCIGSAGSLAVGFLYTVKEIEEVCGHSVTFPASDQ